jgi:hypothetical protein
MRHLDANTRPFILLFDTLVVLLQSSFFTRWPLTYVELCGTSFAGNDADGVGTQAQSEELNLNFGGKKVLFLF